MILRGSVYGGNRCRLESYRRVRWYLVQGNTVTRWQRVGGNRRKVGSREGHQVSIYTLAGELITQWGGAAESAKPGEFPGAPHGICVDSRGDLYVSEVGVNGRLQKFIRVAAQRST
jgi:hypothetical protein